MDNGQYISLNWYPSKAITHKEVPTWNYQAAQFTVTPTWICDREGVGQMISDMTDFFEHRISLLDTEHRPWSLSDSPTSYIDALCLAIVGIKMSIVDVTASFKLSQNKSPRNQQGVIEGLRKTGNAQAMKMADLIKNLGHEQN